MKKIKTALLFSLMAVGFGAQAAALGIEYQGTNGITVTTSSTLDGYNTGSLQFTSSSGGSFEAYCVEVGQGVATTASGYQAYTVGSFTTAQSTLLQGLYSSSYASLSSAGDKAAFQTAIWEIMSEPTGATLDVNTGNFQFYWLSMSSTDAQDSAFAAKANSLLAAAASYSGPAEYTLTKLENPQYQDYVTASAVPEPESYALLLAGLGAIGFVARRRAVR